MGKKVHRNFIEEGEVSRLEMLLPTANDSGIIYRLSAENGRKTLQLPAKISEADAREIWLETECDRVWPPRSQKLQQLQAQEAARL